VNQRRFVPSTDVTAGNAVEKTAPSGAGIARASVLLLAGTVASRLLGLLRDVVVSARFGTSGDLDLYVAAFRVPDLAFTLVSGGALGSALVPVFSQALYRADIDGGPDYARTALVRLAGATTLAVLVAATALAALAASLADSIAPFLGGGFSPDSHHRLAALIRILLMQPVLLGTGEVLARFLNVRGRFGATAFAPAAYTAGIVVAALVAPVELGTFALAWGVVGGALLYVIILAVDASRTGFRLPLSRAHIDGSGTQLAEVLRLMIPRVVGQGAVQLSFVATTRLASYLPAGRLASLNYAWALMMLPLGAFAMTAANAAFPTFAALAARNDLNGLAATGRRSIGTVSVMMAISLAGAVALGSDAIEVLFGRREFGPESIALTASALAAYAVGLPAHGVLEVQMRLAFALKDTRTPVVIGVGAMVVNVAVATFLASALGHVGIGLALSIAATIEAMLLGVILERRLPGVHGAGLAVLAVRLLSVAALAGLAGWSASLAIAGLGGSAITRLGVAGSAFILSAGATAWVLGVPEVADLASSVLRRIRTPSQTA
jgi:putative peptidoglycan lipid II flippase